MDNGSHVDLDVITVSCFILDLNGFGQLVTGHDVLEILEQVSIGVFAAGLCFKTFLQALECDGGVCSKSGHAHAEHHHQCEQEGG